MKTSFRAAWAVLFPCAVLAAAQEPAANPVKDLPNYCEVLPNLGGGGQPTDQGFRLLAEKGYQVVVNLRTEGEKFDLAAEQKLIADLGMKYVPFPFVSKDAKEELALQFVKLLEDMKEQKVYVHCASGNRVGSLIMVDLVLKQGMDAQKAEEIAAKVGLTSEQLRQYARKVIESQKKP
jgi:protein tyrosine phosphatase (PTP) superfamily phosphohydrolase (DUF442 family)